MTIICIHGIRSKGDDNVDLLGEKLVELQHHVIDFDYPTVTMLDVVFRMRGFRSDLVMENARRLHVIADQYKGPDVIAHSMGCLVTLRAMEDGAKFGTVYFFAPALNSDFVIPNWGCEKLVIIHNPHDKAIKWGAKLNWHPFGDMGLIGSKYVPYDWRITNHAVDKEGTDKWGHNYSFEGGALDYWTAAVDRELSV